MFDKRALAMGEPTSIRSTLEAQGEELKVEAINAYLEALPSANPRPEMDSPSTGTAQEPHKTAGSNASDVTLDVSQNPPDRPDGSPPPAPLQPSGQAAAAGEAGHAARPGGGGGAGGGGVI